MGAFRVNGTTVTPLPPALDFNAGNTAGDMDRAIAVDGAGQRGRRWNEAVAAATRTSTRAG